jgi:hypothetical protein
MSNLADFLNATGFKHAEAINLAGDAIGTLADISGAVDAVIGLISILISLSDDTSSKLSEIQVEIAQLFTEMRAEQRAQHILDRLNNLDPAIAQAQTAVDLLEEALRRNPPVSQEFRLQQIGLCLDAVNQLDHDAKWNSVFLDEVYYGQDPDPFTGDLWSGEIVPSQSGNGTVFSDRYILPLYLQTLSWFMLVAGAYDPNYKITFAGPLRRFTDRLQNVYDISRRGITFIRIPTFKEIFGTSSDEYDSVDGVTLRGRWGGLIDPQGTLHEYGMVHTYSGTSSISFYPQLPVPSSGPPAPIEWLDRFNVPFNLALRRNWKEVYNAVGLRDVREIIKTLRSFTGEPPLPTKEQTPLDQDGFDPGSWTIREVHDLLGSAFEDPSGPLLGGFSAVDTISRLATAGGLSPHRPLSFRRALDAALNAATVTPRSGAATPPASPL